MREHIGFGDELVDDRFALRGLQVDLHAFLASVGPWFGHGLCRGAPTLIQSPIGGVDLDDPCAKVSQKGGAVGTGLDGRQVQDGDPCQGVGWHVGAIGFRQATACGHGLRQQASQHVGVVLSYIRGGSARLSRRVLEIHEWSQGAHRAHARIMDRDHRTVGEHRRMIHGLEAVTIGLSGDIAVLEINLHPLVGGFLQLFLQYLPTQALSVVQAEGGNTLELLILKQVSKANGFEMALDVWNPLIGVLEPCAVLGPHGNISDGGEASAAGSCGKALRVHALELHIHQSTVTDIVVVGRGQVLDDAGLDPLSTPAEVPHAEGANDPAHRSLAGVPAAGIHRRIHGAIPVGLSL